MSQSSDDSWWPLLGTYALTKSSPKPTFTLPPPMDISSTLPMLLSSSAYAISPAFSSNSSLTLPITLLSEPLPLHYGFLRHRPDVSKDEVVRELREYFEELSIRFVWLEEHMEHSACLGFESTMNWGAWFGWTWSQFLVTYYPQVVRNTAKAWDISIAQLLTHYSSEDSHTLSMYITSMDTIIPYDPNMPAFDIDLSATQSSFELADSISNMAMGSSSVGGLLSQEKVGQWWPTILVEDGRVFLILYDNKGVKVRRKAIDWSGLTKNSVELKGLPNLNRLIGIKDSSKPLHDLLSYATLIISLFRAKQWALLYDNKTALSKSI
ncbi:hypothetical protein ARMGADRAFT_1037596 [Armillaria gallica]|uniref:Uncharacterized protein n=1 Tax=Armillaria gallica TaxID=47427 RepID=A0A2H3CPG4_ARMGA|nr:hypothetical protein ARMGADRAFT_1037596 [Armillaria gallica]